MNNLLQTKALLQTIILKTFGGRYMQLQLHLNQFLKFSIQLSLKMSLPVNYNFPGRIADKYNLKQVYGEI